MSRTIAYLAGVIDSDGCITIKRRRVKTAAQWNMQASIFVRQITDEAVTLLADTFGGRINKRPSGTPGGRDLYHWELDRIKAVAAAKKLLPYLRIKRRQAQILIEFGSFMADTPQRRRITHFKWSIDEPCYTVAQAVSLKGCTAATIYQAIGNGSIPSRLISGAGHGTRLIPKRFWDAYEVRPGFHTLPAEYIAKRDTFRAAIHALNGPTKGITSLSRLS
jgi:hypothetical protein